MKVQPVDPADRSALISIAVSTGLFSPEEAEGLLGGILDQLFTGALADGAIALAHRLTPDGAVVGWTYVAPDQYADGVWNVWWLGVAPEAQGGGVGRSLLRAAEAHAQSSGARIMVIETSSKDSQARARRFYAKEAYLECGVVPDFYGDGDHKVIFSRRLRGAAPSGALAP